LLKFSWDKGSPGRPNATDDWPQSTVLSLYMSRKRKPNRKRAEGEERVRQKKALARRFELVYNIL